MSKLNLSSFSKEYLMGIPDLDEQHETYFKTLDKLGEAVSDLYKVLDDDEVDNVLDIVAELRDYALNHFGTEESLMRDMDYPGLAVQKAEHNRFIADVVRMEAELMNGSSIPAIKVHTFMHDWFRDHIVEHDKPFGEHYRNNKK